MMSDAMRKAMKDAEDPNAGLDDLIASAGESPAPKVVDVPVPAEQFQAAGAPRTVQTGEAAHAPTQLSRLSAALLSLEQEKPTETELKSARDLDSQQRQAHYMEQAARQLTAGLTLTQPVAAQMPMERGEVAGLQKRSMDYESKRNALLALEGRETDAAAQRGETNRHNMATEALGSQRAPLEAERVKIEKDKAENQRAEVDRRRSAGAQAAKDKAAAGEAAKAEKMANSVIPYGQGQFEPVGGALGVNELTKAQGKAEASALAMKAMQRLRASVAATLAAPTDMNARGRALADVGTAATALNVALGQGAMAGNEFDRVKQSIGDLGSGSYAVDVLKGFLSGDKSKDPNSLVLSRLDQTMQTLDESTKEALRTYRLEWRPAGTPNPSGTPPIPAKGGPVKMKFPDGSTHDVAPADLDLAKRKGGVPIG